MWQHSKCNGFTYKRERGNLMDVRDVTLTVAMALFLLISGCGKESSPPPRAKRTVNFDQLREGTKIKPDQLRRLYQRHGIRPKKIIENADGTVHVAKWTEGDFRLWRVAHSDVSPHSRYLIFWKQRGGKDKYLTDVMFTSSLRSPPHVHFVPMQDGGLLGLRWEAGYGTGVQNYRDSWYRITNNQTKKIMEVPARGYVSGWLLGFNRHYESSIAVLYDGRRIEGIGYRYRVVYRPDSEDLIDSTEPLRSTLTQYWRWNGDTQQLVLDRNLSSATTGEVEAVFDNDTDGFVEDNLDLLKRMELTPNRLQWFEQIASKCQRRASKLALKRLVRQKPDEHADE